MRNQRLCKDKTSANDKGIPECPSVFRKCLMYGPGSPPSASKQSAVSSVMHGPPTYEHRSDEHRSGSVQKYELVNQ